MRANTFVIAFLTYNEKKPLRSTFLALIVLVFVSTLHPEVTADVKARNLASFDYVWKTIREKHWDQSLGGIDWEKVRAELRPRVENARSDEEVRQIISEMLARLHQSHFTVIPGSVYHDVEVPAVGAAASDAGGANAAHADDVPSGVAGFDVRVLDGQAVVVNVESDAPAARLGVRPGWGISEINGEEIAPVIQRVSLTYSDSTLKDMMLDRSLAARLDGPIDESIEIRFRDGNDHERKLDVPRKAPRGVAAKFGYLPESNVWFENRRLESGVEYIAFNFFLDPARLIPAFQKSVRGCDSCAGIIIDIRGNAGGIGILAMGLAGYFMDKPDQKLGTMYMRNLPLKFEVNPRPPVYKGPVAILIDGLSASTSEIFAGGMQDLHRARIFGTRSAGAALPSMIERLPNGDGFQYAAAAYKSESGRTLEGAGVVPDEVVLLTRKALAAGRDPVIEAAVQWIHDQSKGNAKP